MFDVTMLAGKRIPLTEKHIEESVKNSVRHHPVALAINDIADKSVITHVRLLSEKITFHSGGTGEKVGELLTTSELETWMWDYQKDKPISSCVLFVFRQDDVSEGEPRDDRLWIGIEKTEDVCEKQQDRIFLGYTQSDGKRVVYIGGIDTEKTSKPLDVKPSLAIVNHSPTGFNWGYNGSGPAQLALAILLELTDDATLSQRHYQRFKSEVIAHMPDKWQMPENKVWDWLKANYKQRMAK